MRIIISGASGLIGTALVSRLRDHDHQVTVLVRHAARGAHEVQWDPTAGTLSPDALAGADAVINLSGAAIAGKRWTPAYQQEVLSSRVDTTGLLARAIAASGQRPGVFVSGSAIGYYGDTGDTSVDETATPGQGFLADVCQKWEAATAPAGEAGVRVVTLRTGLVLARRGGYLAPQLVPAKLGLGGRLGTGRQYQSWITLEDEIRAIEFLLGSHVAGPVNLTAPTPVTQAVFAKTLGRVLHRPAVTAVPAFVLKAALGPFAQEGVLAGQRVVPAALLAAGFTFSATELEPALRDTLRG